MEKILENEFRNALYSSLEEAGLKHDEIRKIINKKYEEALKNAVVDRLKEVAKLVREGRYSVIEDMISDSPSGDGYGCDNKFIDFSDVTGLEDIGDVVCALKSCKGE